MDKGGNDNSTVIDPLLPKNDKEVTHTMASLYALQVALQTMKERCQQLQQRLSVVEDENLKLRIEKQRLQSNSSQEESKGEVNALQEHIAQLTRQKSQLTQHIYMVATENKQLWTRLSRLTEANQSLGSHLTKISDTLHKHSLGESSKPNQSIQIMNSCDKDADVSGQKEESLEEISLKIISSMIREKLELEQQCDQMSALQTGTLSVEDCDFTLGTDSGDHEDLINEFRKILENLRDEKEQLQKHRAGLKAMLITFSTVIKNGLICKTCKRNDNIPAPDEKNKLINRDQTKPNDLSTVREPPIDSEDNCCTRGIGVEIFEEDRICPLCSQFFHRSTKFEDFHTHVLTHFSDEEGDFESIITNSYEVVK